RERALAVRGADAVRTGVATADHHHVLALGKDWLDVVELFAGDALVLLAEEIHREMDAVELAARNGQVAGLLGAARKGNGVILLDEVVHLYIDADMDAEMK